MPRSDYNADEAYAERHASHRKKRQRYGDGGIILLFVLGVAGVITSFASNTLILALVGFALIIIGFVALARPSSRERNGKAQVYQCNSCGYAFEMEVKHPRPSISCNCPRCGKYVSCKLIKRGR